MGDTEDSHKSAKYALIDNLFEDFYKKKWRVYRINFVRGVFFGIGSVIGGTIVVAMVVWLLSWLVDLPGGIGSFVQYIVDQVQNR